MKENSIKNERSSIEEAVKTMEHWVEYEKNNKDKINKADELIYIQETILSDYKRVLEINEVLLKENEILKEEKEQAWEEWNNLEQGSYETEQKLKQQIKKLQKENEELKNIELKSKGGAIKVSLEGVLSLENKIKQLEKENEELKFKERSRIIGEYGDTEIHNVINKTLSNDYISVQKVKDIIDRIDYDIKKTKEIISKNTNIYTSYRKNDYQIVRLKAMNTKSLDIKKRLQELLESEE